MQALIADGDGAFLSRIFIKGLIGYTPQSDIFGMLESHTRYTGIIIKEDPEPFPSERLAEDAMLQQMEVYLKQELEEDWLLLESFFFLITREMQKKLHGTITAKLCGRMRKTE